MALGETNIDNTHKRIRRRWAISEIYLDHANKDLKKAGVRHDTGGVCFLFFFFLNPTSKHQVMSQFIITNPKYHRLLFFFFPPIGYWFNIPTQVAPFKK